MLPNCVHLPFTRTALLSPRESAVLSFIFSTRRCFTFFIAGGRGERGRGEGEGKRGEKRGQKGGEKEERGGGKKAERRGKEREGKGRRGEGHNNY